MNNDLYEATLADLRRANRKKALTIGVLIATQLLSAASLYRAIGFERIIVSPPNLSSPFWVRGGKYDDAYLEQMGGYIAWLVLDVAPSSIEWKKTALLSLVSPRVEGLLKQRQELEAERLKRLNASTDFLPQQFSPDEAKQTVLVAGLLHTRINGQDTPPVPKTYEIAFNNEGGRIHLGGFTEVKQNGQATMAGAASATAGDGRQP